MRRVRNVSVELLQHDNRDYVSISKLIEDLMHNVSKEEFVYIVEYIVSTSGFTDVFKDIMHNLESTYSDETDSFRELIAQSANDAAITVISNLLTQVNKLASRNDILSEELRGVLDQWPKSHDQYKPKRTWSSGNYELIHRHELEPILKRLLALPRPEEE